ncbi:hypothetical protein [Methylobacterium sp. A54F]
MTVESWIAPEETAALAAAAAAMIDANLGAGPDGIGRDAFWAAVRKGYNTPYNDPPPRSRPAPVEAVEVDAVQVEILATEILPVEVVQAEAAPAAVPSEAMPPEVIALAAAASLGEIRTA